MDRGRRDGGCRAGKCLAGVAGGHERDELASKDSARAKQEARSILESPYKPTEAAVLVTACPACLLNLKIAAARRAEAAGRSVEVLDLGSYLLARLRGAR